MKQKLILTRGLPASGKSTWAKKMVDEQGFKRVNKDDIRAMLDNGNWNHKNESLVIDIRDYIVGLCLGKGYDVIVDDTNLNPTHFNHLKELFKDQLDVIDLEVKDFDVPLEECIRRDIGRPNTVGEKVIKKMYRQYLAPKVEKPELIPGKPFAIICDLDGTLALFGDKDPYNRDFTKDDLNEPVANLVKLLAKTGKSVIYVSGRSHKYFHQTASWLSEHDLPNGETFMRADNDFRKDFIVKQELYEKNIKGNYNIEFVLDDRNQVVELWRSLGLTVFQVAEGDF